MSARCWKREGSRGADSAHNVFEKKRGREQSLGRAGECAAQAVRGRGLRGVSPPSTNTVENDRECPWRRTRTCPWWRAQGRLGVNGVLWYSNVSKGLSRRFLEVQSAGANHWLVP
jgi:hypothetical protein